MTKNKIIFLIVIAALFVFFIITIFSGLDFRRKPILPPGTHGTVVREVLQTSNYTYLNVEEADSTFWMAIISAPMNAGDSVYFTRAMEMKDFRSKELGRTFPSIFFVDDPVNTLHAIHKPLQQQRTPKRVEVKKWPEISVQVPQGGITLESLYRDPRNFTGKSVTIRGVVVRYNSEIMNRNWVHLQDGTEFEGKFDLAVTTGDSLLVGQQATFTGIIALNRDFGSGYTYDVIMEQAKASDIK